MKVVCRRGIKNFAHYALRCFKTKLCDKLWIDIRLNNFRPNWTQIVLLLEKRIFWENWLILFLFTYFGTLCYYVSENNLIVGQIMRYKILLFGAKLNTNNPFALAGDFFGKLTMLILPTSCTPSQYWIMKCRVA